ncbi:EF hand family protein [Tritrichomonas foetus]|uniref:EF hand family protein n=1 Tax=Tritrichomonas foetus TaxID=1144522 RepID=A0A1J4L028_9EUKA|nr:EF hand family protein [Tritrichomonas foetus]|eukprot:OHT16480.1 EF hand family protein [Tritrichomonas foetus]
MDKRLSYSKMSLQGRKKYEEDHLLGLASYLSVQGFDEVAQEFLKILNGKKNFEKNDKKDIENQDRQNKTEQNETHQSKTIPLFVDNKVSTSKESNMFLEYIQLKRKEKYQNKVLTKGDIEIIENHLHLPGLRKESRSRIDFKGLSRKLPKFAYLFDDKLLNHSNFTSRNHEFNLHCYHEFIRRIYNIETSLVTFLEVSPNFSMGSIDTDEFDEFVSAYSINIRALSNLQNEYEWFVQYYAPIVTSRFTFDFCQIPNNKFDGNEVIFSNLFEKFVDMDNQERKHNPFTLKETINLFNVFVKHDANKNGQLQRENLKKLSGFVFSDAFLERMFEIMQLYEGFMEFNLFIFLMTALRNLKSRQTTKFFFSIFDLEGKGTISPNDINYFYKAMIDEIKPSDSSNKSLEKKSDQNKYTHNFDHFLAKLLDLIGGNSDTITEEMIFKSNCQDLIFKLLFDIKTFKEWELLEHNFGDEEEEEEECL